MACVFNKQLLHPCNWLTWFGLGILWLIVQLPYPLLHFIGTSAGRLSRRFLKRREHIARRNIELCFPGHVASGARDADRSKLYVAGNGAYRNRRWPGSGATSGSKKWFDVEGFANLNHALSGGKGVMGGPSPPRSASGARCAPCWRASRTPGRSSGVPRWRPSAARSR